MTALRRVLTCVALAAGVSGARAVAPADATCFAPSAGDDGWEISTPVAAGFDAGALCAALEEVARGDANIHGVVVERHGKLVAELYRSGPDQPIDVLYGIGNPFASDVRFDAATLHDTRSVSKSVVGLLVGIALGGGKLPSIDTSVLSLFPELADLRSPASDAITIRHLLDMSSGLAWAEWSEGTLTSDETRLFWKADPVRFVFDRPRAAPPGTAFNYNSGGTATLAELLTRASGKPLVDLARAQLFEPLGITQWDWAVDLRDRPLAFTGLRMRPRDMAKLGRLMLDHGRWRGRQIVPAEWVAESLRAQIATRLRVPPDVQGGLGYGNQWWNGRTEWKDRSVGWGEALGNGGQRIFVVPELDLGVVTTAGAYGRPEIARDVGGLFEKVVAAVLE